MRLVPRLLCFLLPASYLFAQTATLRGVVTDESGALVPSAKVLLTGPGSQTRSATSDGSGTYSFTGLPPGSYTVQASAPQLAQTQPGKIALKSGVQTLNLQLTVAAIEERVTVQDNSGPSVSTAAGNNASALVLQGSDLDALSDNPDDLMADLQALAGPSAGPNGGSIFIDGFSGGELPAKESIREIRINQNPFSPEYDKLGYGRIEIFTKPGTDKYRGTADYNLGTEAWNSRNPYAPRKAPFLLNEFEGNASGPITRRSSFTLDAQRNMVDNGAITNAVALDPTTLAVTPFTSVLIIPGRFTRVTPRIDYQLNGNHTLMFRYGVTRAGAQNVGVGSFDLASRGYHNQFTNQTVQVAETAVFGTTINETRFQYYRSAGQTIANNFSPALQVLGSFNGGGALAGRSFDTQNTFELQNYTSMLRGRHSWKFGVRLRAQTEDSIAPVNFNGTFTFGGGGLEPFTSIERYRRTLLFQQLGDSPAVIRSLGGGATQFSINAGNPELAAHQADVGIFAGDDWRARPNLTLSFGLRYETQTNIHDWRDFAPRVALAWAPGGSAKTRAKTVLRAGFGMFYDRFSLGNSLTALRYNGINQQQYVIANPDFFPTVPPLTSLAGFQSTQTTQEISARLRAPYIMQTAITLERQLPRNTTFAVTYTNSHGLHVFRSEDINAPLPGTYNSNISGSGVFPAGRPGPIFLMESAGLYNQNQVISNVNAKVNSGLSLFGFYVFNKAMSNTDGLGTFPANPYDHSGDYGPASTDIRHRVTAGGSISLRWNVRISPFVVMQTGAPFDITAGSDLFGTTLFNGRPGIAADSAKPGLIRTAYGLFDPNPAPGEPLLPRNFGRGPGQINMNLRVAKSIGFGKERGKSGGDARPVPSGVAASPNAASGGGLRPIIGAPTTTRRYNLTISMSIRNLLNHNNPGPIVGNITSPLFGRANQIAGAPNGEGFYETANNRRLESQIRFTF
jgi:Carboxypeptidase regulatory-like domain